MTLYGDWHTPQPIPKRNEESDTPSTPIHNGTGEDGLEEILTAYRHALTDKPNEFGGYIAKESINALIQSEKDKLIKELLEKLPVPPRQANELYPQDYVDGYTQAKDDFDSVIQRMMTTTPKSKENK